MLLEKCCMRSFCAMINKKRKEQAIKILSKAGLCNLEYLGQGFEGVVFHDKKWVYKVIVPFFEGGSKWYTYSHLSFFFENDKYDSFYNLNEIIETDEGSLIEKYLYEKSEKVTSYTEEECIKFLTDSWRKKIVVPDCKCENFIRVNGILKLIDLDACKYYSDTLFLNACARMYIFIHFKEHPNLKKIQRSAINNFDIPELAGLREFVNRIFANIIYEESKNAFPTEISIAATENSDLIFETYAIETLPNLDKLFYKKIKENLYMIDIKIDKIVLSKENTFEPCEIQIAYKKICQCPKKVSLLIKTCAMDVATIEQNVKHIVRQLSCPHTFDEVVVSIDSKKENFLRQYTDNSDYDKVIQIAEKLKDENVIDRYIIFNPDEAARINKEWFNLETTQTHSAGNVPVSSQLYAFENCKGDYILQMDSDVLIGRKDFNHNYLQDMMTELDKNTNVVSVGFNIYNKESKEYFGFENGGFVPEVRLGLFDKKRFFDLRPLPNSLDAEKRLKLTWYRSMQQHQKDMGMCSIRGGDHRTFFIHPQNYRKTETYAWMNILDRVEQLEIPECQYGNFDCEGSFYEWCAPKRNEDMVVISCFKNITVDRFLRFFYSLLNQRFKGYGLVLYDDASDNGVSWFIEKAIKPYRNKITYIKGRNHLAKAQCEYLVIHNICTNPESIIVCADTDDALIGKEALFDVYKKYQMWGVDMTCGRVHQTYRIQPYYRYSVNFLEPRASYGGNVWQHLKTFKKYLFDSIPISYFMHEGNEKKFSKRKWLEKCDDYAMMIPIVEMSTSPYQMDFINYYYERDYENRNADRDLKNQCIEEILAKKKLSEENVHKGRIAFASNLEKIEIDITFDCNLKCKGCNRSCGLAPSTEKMSLQDIHNFIADSIKNQIKWKLINILGGEPTLHPELGEIVELLQKNYADVFNPSVVIQIVSNGFTEKSRQICDKLECENQNVRIDRESYKTKNTVAYFTPFADAPCDDEKFAEADFSKACWVASYCGIGLNKNGYYACSVCGGIDRVLGNNEGVKTMSQLTPSKQKEHFEKFCRYCGNYKHYASAAGNFIARCEKAPFKEKISPSWKRIYDEYNNAQN